MKKFAFGQKIISIRFWANVWTQKGKNECKKNVKSFCRMKKSDSKKCFTSDIIIYHHEFMTPKNDSVIISHSIGHAHSIIIIC